MSGRIRSGDTRSRVAELAELEAYHASEVVPCVRCPLSRTRTQVVVGAGNPDADLMLVGEAPGHHEDRQGLPFVGQAGQLLNRLLQGIGLAREDVFVANVLKCRPPENRDPQPSEIAACEGHLYRQIGLIRPRVVATLGNFATRLLSGRQVRIGEVHGHELPLQIGDLAVLLYPLHHPAAALYTRATLSTLEADVARIPELLARAAPAGGPEVEPAPEFEPEPEPEREPRSEPVGAGAAEQLGLF